MRLPHWVVTVAAVALLVGACGTRAPFSDSSFDEIEDAFRDGGLRICATDDVAGGIANMAVRSRTYEVGANCTDDDRAQVAVDEFDDVDDRDAAVRNGESLVRPRGSGAVWTFGATSIFVFGTSDDPVFEQVTQALDDVGAAR